MGGGVAFSVIPIQTQLPALLSESGNLTHQILLNQLQEGPTSRMILLALKGASRPVLAQASMQLAQAMQTSGHFAYVRNGQQALGQNDQAILFRYRYLLSPSFNPLEFQAAALQVALERRISDLANLLPLEVKRKILEDPTQKFPDLLKSFLPSHALKTENGVWLSSHEDLAYLVTETTGSGFDLDFQDTVQRFLTQHLASLREKIPGATTLALLQTGPSFFAVHSKTLIQSEALWLTVLGSSAVLIFLFLVYRSITFLILSVIPIGTGILLACFSVFFAFGSLHGITLAFGATLIGVAIDYPIHLFTHMNPHESPGAAMSRIWPTIRLGALTTAVGFGALLFSEFPGLSQLGLFAIIGSLSAAFTTKWVLPPLLDHHSCGNIEPKILWHIPSIANGARGLFLLSILTSIGYVGFSSKPVWETDIGNLSPISPEMKLLDTHLREELGAPSVRHLLVLTGSTVQQVLEGEEQLGVSLAHLVRENRLQGFESAAKFLPSVKTQEYRKKQLPESADLEAQLREAMKNLPYRPAAFHAFRQAVSQSKELPPLTPRHFDGTPLGSKISSLLYPLQERWIGLILLQGVREGLNLNQGDNFQENVYYLDLKTETNHILLTYRDGILTYLAWGGVALILLLGFSLRSFSGMLKVIFPVAGALIITLGILHALDERLSVFHLASLLLVSGLGIDYALFLLQPHDQLTDRARTTMSVLVCSVTTLIVFGLLSFSQTPVLHSIGLTTFWGAVMCLGMTVAFSFGRTPYAPDLV